MRCDTLIMPSVVAFGVFAGAVIGTAHGAERVPQGNVKAGERYAKQVCAQCHDVSTPRDTPIPGITAPNFYSIANGPTTSMLSLNVFLTTPHANMPNLIIPDKDRRNVVAYIFSLRHRDRKEPA